MAINTDKSDEAKVVQFATYIPPEVKREINIKAAEQGKKASQLVADLLIKTYPVRKLTNSGKSEEA